MHTKPLLAVCLGAWLLAACGMVQDLKQYQEKSEAMTAALEQELGAKPQVSWNINNGKFTYVNVIFPLEGVARLPIGELEAKVRAAVIKSFDQRPEQLLVSVASKP